MDGLENAMRCGWIRFQPADAPLGNSSTSPGRAVVQTHLHNRPNDPVAYRRRFAVVRFPAAVPRSALSIRKRHSVDVLEQPRDDRRENHTIKVNSRTPLPSGDQGSY